MNDTEALAKLVGEMEHMAKDLVGKRGKFPPFGGMIDAAGKPKLVFDSGPLFGSGGKVERSVGLLLKMLRSEAASGKWEAVGLASMRVHRGDGGQQFAILISMHHRQGRRVDYAVIFNRSASGNVTYEPPQVGWGHLQFF